MCPSRAQPHPNGLHAWRSTSPSVRRNLLSSPFGLYYGNSIAILITSLLLHFRQRRQGGDFGGRGERGPAVWIDELQSDVPPTSSFCRPAGGLRLEETLSETFGFIGLGNMGQPMAGRLIDAGHSLVVHDVRDSAAEQFVERGAKRASSPVELASTVETIFLSLPTPQVVESVALGESGLISGEKVRRIVDLSTTGPRMAESIGNRFKERGVRWLDSPVSGGVGGARAGTGAVMFSGPREDYDDLLPVLKVIGKPFYIGDKPGLAQMMKLVNNCLSAAAMALTSEAVVMGAKAGIPPKVMIDVINAGSGRNTATLQKFPQSILPRSFDYGFATGLMHKDVMLFMEEARRMGLSLEGCQVVFDLWQKALDKLGPDSDFTKIVTLMEEQAGVEVRGE